MLPCPSSVVCGSTPCSGGTISAPTKVERISTISGRLSYPFSRREREFVLSVEDDENHTEGVERGHKRTDQTCHHQIDMTIRHRTREDTHPY